MSRKSHERIVEAWKHNHPAREKTMSTDGLNLFSYDLQIGLTDGAGKKIVLDYTKDGGHFISQTTSTQVGEAKKVADIIRLIPKKNKIYPPSGSCTGGLSAARAESDSLLKSPMKHER
ncbi:MAG: hypothetical protein PHW62_00690 [Candidatus Ratteibacteria bacterium]|nr:hypothetical protein [Candidatus Ratteibacteria bacterium]